MTFFCIPFATKPENLLSGAGGEVEYTLREIDGIHRLLIEDSGMRGRRTEMETELEGP